MMMMMILLAVYYEYVLVRVLVTVLSLTQHVVSTSTANGAGEPAGGAILDPANQSR